MKSWNDQIRDLQNSTEAVDALLCTTPTWNSIMLTGMQTTPSRRRDQ